MGNNKQAVSPVTPDEIDIALLNALLLDSRQSLRELAKHAGISAATAMQRIKRLEKVGFIRRYSVEMDYERLGYDLQVIIEMRVSKGRLMDVEKKIAAHPNVFATYDATGDFDVFIIAKFKTRRAMDQFLKKIQTYPFVERTKTSLILSVIKEEPLRL